MESSQLTQVITSPTRVTVTTETLIYHMYTTHPEHVRASNVGFLSASDHHPVIMLRKHNSSKTDTMSLISYRSCTNFDSDNFIYDRLHVPWSDIEKCTDVDVALDTWMTLFIGVCVCDKHAPVKRRNVKNKKHSDWLTRNSLTGSQETA